MLTYRRIDHEKQFALHIWHIERQGPLWFREASSVWTPTLQSFLEFYSGCEVWGLFDSERDGDLLAVVYLEFLNECDVNIHISVLEKLPIDEIVRFFTSLTRHKTEAEGVRGKQAWILRHNRFLLDIAKRSNYHPSGLEMTYGSARGKSFEWIQVVSQ